jgi:hypothetical protein
MPGALCRESPLCVYLGHLITGSIDAENGRDRRRNYTLYSFIKTVHKQIAGRIAIIGAIRQKADNRSFNLIEKFGQNSEGAHVVFCQIGANDISSREMQSKVELAPRLTFGPLFYAYSATIRLHQMSSDPYYPQLIRLGRPFGI